MSVWTYESSHTSLYSVRGTSGPGDSESVDVPVRVSRDVEGSGRDGRDRSGVDRRPSVSFGGHRET